MGSLRLASFALSLLAVTANAAVSPDLKSALSDACETDFYHPGFVRSRNVPSLPNVPIDHCKNLLDDVNDVNGVINPSAGSIPLANAVTYGWGEVVKMLLAAGAEVEMSPASDLLGTELMMAAQMGWPNVCEILLSAGADINKKKMSEEYGETALDNAKENNHTEVIEVLKKHGATDPILGLEDILEFHGMTPSQINNYDEREYSISYGLTPIIYAAAIGNKEACKLLIDAGADVNLLTFKGTLKGDGTALMMAANRGFTEISEMLIEAGADVDIQNRNGETALMKTVNGVYSRYSPVRSEKKDIAVMLMAAGADINKRDNTGWTALKTAKMFKNKDIAKILEDAGAQV